MVFLGGIFENSFSESKNKVMQSHYNGLYTLLTWLTILLAFVGESAVKIRRITSTLPE